MKTPAIQAASVGPSHAPAPPSRPSAYTSSALTNPRCGQTWHATSSSRTELVPKRTSTDPIGILCIFLVYLSPTGPKRHKMFLPACRAVTGTAGDCSRGASNSTEALSCLQSHKLKPIHKTVCFVNMKVQHKAFRHQLNLNIIVFIVMNNKSFSTAL